MGAIDFLVKWKCFLRRLFIFVLGATVGVNMTMVIFPSRCNPLTRNMEISGLLRVVYNEDVVLPSHNQFNEELRTNSSQKIVRVQEKSFVNMSSKILSEVIPFFKKLPEKYLRNRKPRRQVKEFLLRPVVKPGPSLIMFFVKSACQYSARRDLIRQTWGSIESINQEKFRLVFLVGNCKELLQVRILEENDKHHDILQANISDGYKFLPDKVLSAYQWLYYEAGNISNFYGFTDDDCLIKMLDIYKYFKVNRNSLLAKNTVYCGYIYSNESLPSRNPRSKYYVAYDVYSEARYPQFCHGGLILASHKTVADIYRIAEVTERGRFHLEDVYVAGILREKVGNGSISITTLGKNRFSKKYKNFVVHLGLSDNLVTAFHSSWMTQLMTMTIHKGNDVIPGISKTSKQYHATMKPTTSSSLLAMHGFLQNNKNVKKFLLKKL
ncbi:uncharacterized protein LOC143470769 [Clavelina lepadiformis]|uniref:uncharacterized protein LOC143470769 n=1 Tax=Clavelina lepadiformis TaxID=159417 RepID=UPI004042651B